MPHKHNKPRIYKTAGQVDMILVYKNINKVIFILIIICFLQLPVFADSPEVKKQDTAQETVIVKDYQNINEKWGIKPLHMRLSAGGYMLDFRYRVTDAEKASPIFSRALKPFLIDQATGAKFSVPEPPKVGALRQTRRPAADKNYFIIFANPGNYVKKGNRVTVVIGELKIENLVVE